MQKGFTLLEIVIAAGIIGILALILIPLAVNELGKADVTKAQGDINGLISAITHFREDTKEYPDRRDSRTADYYHFLYTGDSSTMPKVPSSWGTRSDRVFNHLKINGRGYRRWDNTLLIGWHGPYLDRDSLDPWGKGYLVGVRAFWDKSNTYYAWILSAGKNGVVETNLTSQNIPPGSDDIGRWIYISR